MVVLSDGAGLSRFMILNSSCALPHLSLTGGRKWLKFCHLYTCVNLAKRAECLGSLASIRRFRMSIRQPIALPGEWAGVGDAIG